MTRAFRAVARTGRRISLRVRLVLTAAVCGALVLLIAVAAWRGMSALSSSERDVQSVSTAQRFHQDGDMMHDALRASVFQALLLPADASAARRARITAELGRFAARFRTDLQRAADVATPGARRALNGIGPRLNGYIAAAERLTALAATDRRGALAQLPAFERSFERLATVQDAVTGMLAGTQSSEASTAKLVQSRARRDVVLVVLVALSLMAAIAILLGRSVARSLESISAVAEAIIDGNRAARIEVVHDDEVGRVASAVNLMADNLTELIRQIETEAEHEGFGRELIDAFETADEEAAAHTVVELAMAEIAAATPMELLLADSSEAHLTQAATHPTAGAPGCDVRSPFSCVAVRRGTSVVFDSSTSLDACPHLRGRPDGDCAAACVPVTFMGRALGVLHAAAPDGQPPSPIEVSRLATLAEQAGARIGTVRAFEKTQLQASTDPLTGALNRRSIENELRKLVAARQPFALAMLDLDHFKALNDTHGHDSGDRALRQFAHVLKSTVRDADRVARFGGEEFVAVFPNATASDACDVLQRVRNVLSGTLAGGEHPTFTYSAGVTDTSASTAIDELLRIADQGLYRAKTNGRDRTCIGASSTSSADNPAAANAVSGTDDDTDVVTVASPGPV